MTNHQLFSLPVFSAFTIAQYYSYVARGVFLSFGISPWVETLMNKVDFTVLSDTRVLYFCLEKTFLCTIHLSNMSPEPAHFLNFKGITCS
ncbi:hypothetical protein GGU10DRAFT_433773 [Lentinula aff. detonsa]|uniref:Uncharacterized protein n=1 Tax=Lentinula aff. detonsa TaxID=2804958 RepID=A0AA38KRB1_9AGAR|nr:hypothetical protein GGU10DRAFT_433773 [Lentinula aff. detonsa]